MQGLGRCLLVAATSLLLTTSASAATPWSELRRPLDLPQLAPGSACPVSGVDQRVDWPSANIFGGSGIGPGPVYAGLGGEPVGEFLASQPYPGGWLRGKLFWYVKPSYRGRVLIRGARIDGSGKLGFPIRGGRVGPGMRIQPGETVGWTGRPPKSRGIPSSTLVTGPGCYTVQIDGSRFSRTIVFTASTD